MNEHQTANWSLLHTPEEMQKLSNLGHRVEGILLIMVAVLAIGEATGILKIKLLWPSVIVVAGAFLIAFLLLHHGLSKFKLVWSLILSDGQQRQHLIMASLLIIAGMSEIIYRTWNVNTFRFAWPLVICTIGILFLIHEQHGSSEAVEWAQTIHRYLGLLLILVSICIVLNITLGETYRWLLYLWPSLLIATSILLLIYQEPKGAYKQDGSHESHKEMTH